MADKIDREHGELRRRRVDEREVPDAVEDDHAGVGVGLPVDADLQTVRGQPFGQTCAPFDDGDRPVQGFVQVDVGPAVGVLEHHQAQAADVLKVLGALGISFGLLFFVLYLGLPAFAAIRIQSGGHQRYLSVDGPNIVGMLRWVAAVCAWTGRWDRRAHRGGWSWSTGCRNATPPNW